MLTEETGRIGICSDCILGSRTTFDQVYKGHRGEAPRSLFLGVAGGRNLYAV